MGAAFCRNCGARYEDPANEQIATPPPTVAPSDVGGSADGRGRPSGALIFLGVATILAAAAIAAAFLVSGNDSASTTTVVTQSGETSEPEGNPVAPAPAPGGSIEAGRYVQAGSFKFAADAEKERQRLAADGVDVYVVPSEGAQELYPGFQVLLGGPLHSGSEEADLLKQLHRNGVPSAFARPLTPAHAAASNTKLARGSWSGQLQESSTANPKLDRTLPVTFVTSPDGKEGRLVFLDIDCVAELQAEPGVGPTLKFERSSGCFAGTWQVRPSQGKLMLTYLPPDSDLIVLGEMHPT